ncbi:ribosome biogenesis regulator, partial [Reticulomyxa filosa]
MNPIPMELDKLFSATNMSEKKDEGDQSTANAEAVTNKYLQEISRANLQALVNELCKLPTSVDEDHSGLVTRLPRKAKFPRAKPVPTEKPPTRWETFALQQGIRKKKRNVPSVAWDEQTQGWKRKQGYKKANDPMD